MKLYCILLACSLTMAQTPSPKPEPPKFKPDELCTLEGVVRNAATGEPLKKTTVMVMPMDNRGGQQMTTTSTEADGKFSVKGLEPGQYRLSANRSGFVRMDYGARPGAVTGSPLTLEKGQAMKSLEFKMSPHAVITGRVLDEDGDPVQSSSVMLFRHRYIQGRKQMMTAGGASTNDLGEYRMFGIAPGKYYLSVSVPNYAMFGTISQPGAAPEEGYAPTYYPGTNDMAFASLITVAQGGLLQGTDIRLRKMRTYRIKGKVVGARTPRGGMVLVNSKGGNDFTMMDRNMGSWRGASGDFEVRGLRPGSYIVQAEYSESPDQRFGGRVPVEVTDHDVADVVITLGPGVEVQGTVRLDGESTAKLEELALVLIPKGSGMMMRMNEGRLTDKGVFTIARVTQDEFQIQVRGMPPDHYLKSARLGETEVLENGLDLTQLSSAIGIDIVISPGAAKFTGTVVDEKDKPIRGATIILRPTNAKLAMIGTLTKTATTDQNGQFKIEGVVPGDYQSLAFDGLDVLEVQDPDVFKEYESKAIKIEFKEKAQESKQFKAIVR